MFTRGHGEHRVFSLCSPCLCVRLIKIAVDDTEDALLHHRGPEIEQVSQSEPGEFEVGEHLFLMGGVHVFHRLEFDDDFALYDRVGAEAFFKAQPIKLNRNRYLASNLQTLLPQTMGKQNLITLSSKPGPNSR